MLRGRRKETQTPHKGILSQTGKSFIQPLISLHRDKPEWEEGVAQNFLNHLNLIRSIFFSEIGKVSVTYHLYDENKKSILKKRGGRNLKGRNLKGRGKRTISIQKNNILLL